MKNRNLILFYTSAVLSVMVLVSSPVSVSAQTAPETLPLIHWEDEATQPHGSQDKSASGGLPQLDTSHWPAQIFWLLIFFAVTYLILSRKALPMIGDVLEEREKRINDDTDAAHSLRDEAEAVKKSYEAAIAEAREKARAAIVTAQNEAAAQISKSEQEIAETIQTRMQDAEIRIASAKSEAMKDVRSIAAELVQVIVPKLSGMEVSANDARKAVGAATQQKEAA